MKIAILHSGDLNGVSPGGVDRYVKSMIKGLGPDRVTVFGTTSASTGMRLGESYENEHEGVSYHFVPVSYNSRTPLCVYYALALPKFFKQLNRFDCIYSQRIEYTIPFFGSGLNRKVFQMIHGSSAYTEMGLGKMIARVYPFFEKWAIGIARRTYIVLNRAEFGVPYYKQLYQKYSDKISYGRNPIDCAYYSGLSKKEARGRLSLGQGSIVVYSGRVVHNPKRVLLLPEICKSLMLFDSSIRFIVIGDGDDLEDVKRTAQRLGVQDRFLFTGYISDSEVIKTYLCAADVSVNISYFEGTSTSILESLACGTPVVSTDVGDIHECLDGVHNGIVIPNRDNSVVRDAVRAISDILNNGIPMNESFMEYDLPRVANSFVNDILSIGDARCS